MKANNKYSQAVKEEALRLGFDDCGIASVQYLEENHSFLKKWIRNDYHAGMNYLSVNTEKRADPAKLVEGAKSVVSVVLSYYTGQKQADPSAPIISRYAYGEDYHRVVGAKLNTLLHFVTKNIPGTTGRAFVDSSGVFEKTWAQRSGLGWIGKNSLLITPRFGSFVFIGELIITAALEPDEPFEDQCGNCKKCMDACPNKAIVAERTLDARKCISFHTIEKKEENNRIPAIDPANHVYGCDICQNVCPYNNNLEPKQPGEFIPKPGLLDMSAKDWFTMDEQKFNAFFRGTVVQRIGFKRLQRNLMSLIP